MHTEPELEEILNAPGAPAPYNPVIQTYIHTAPPALYKGVRYAMAQGPSVVPKDTTFKAVQTAISFNLSTMKTAVQLASARSSQLITFPELFLTGYEFGAGAGGAAIAKACADYLDAANIIKAGGIVSNLAAQYKITIVCTTPMNAVDPMGNAGVYDVAVVFGPDGKIMGTQFKTHLWGIDEKTWFRIPEFPPTNKPVHQGFTLPHDDTSPYAPFIVNGFPVGIGICYDAEFPEVARCQALNGSLLTVFPTAAPVGLLKGQTEPYPNIDVHYIPAASLTNMNFTSYSNRAGWEYNVDSTGVFKQVLKYTGNSILTNAYGQALVKPRGNEDCLLIADAIYCDFKPTQPADVDYLTNRRPELCGYLTNKEVNFPFGNSYVYPDNPPQHADVTPRGTNKNSCVS